jgi:hypothetical protein
MAKGPGRLESLPFASYAVGWRWSGKTAKREGNDGYAT